MIAIVQPISFHSHAPDTKGVRVTLFSGSLESQALLKGYPRKSLLLDLATIIAHEIYSHAVPMWEMTTPIWPGPCRDPVRREEPTQACSILRENVIRRELGLPERTTYEEDDLGFVRHALSPSSP